MRVEDAIDWENVPSAFQQWIVNKTKFRTVSPGLSNNMLVVSSVCCTTAVQMVMLIQNFRLLNYTVCTGFVYK